jgi:hypothetical protein
MKCAIIYVLVCVAAASVSAFTLISHAPIRPLPEAYDLAMQTLGARTNVLACIEAKRHEIRRWDFVFAGTNDCRVVVCVSDFSEKTNGCWIDSDNK